MFEGGLEMGNQKNTIKATGLRPYCPVRNPDPPPRVIPPIPEPLVSPRKPQFTSLPVSFMLPNTTESPSTRICQTCTSDARNTNLAEEFQDQPLYIHLEL